MMQVAPMTPTPTPIPAWAATGRLCDDPRAKSSGRRGLLSSKLPPAVALAVDMDDDSAVEVVVLVSVFVDDDGDGSVICDKVKDEVSFRVDVEVVREELRGAGLSVMLK